MIAKAQPEPQDLKLPTHPLERIKHATIQIDEAYYWATYRPPLRDKELAGAVSQTRYFIQEICAAALELDERLAVEVPQAVGR